MSKRSHKKFTAGEKYPILQEGESSTMSINEVCRRHGISTVTYYSWREKVRQAAVESLRNHHHGKKSSKSRHELEKSQKYRLLTDYLHVELPQGKPAFSNNLNIPQILV